MAMVILRAEKLKSLGNVAGSLSHTYRTRETPNAAPERFAANTLQSSPQEVLAALKARLPEKRRKDAVIAVEYFIGASPEWFKGRSQDDQDKYFADALTWLKARHGADNVLDFSIHRDETSPHAVAYVVPLVEGKLNAKRFLGGRAALSSMQTDFAKKVGRSHQLERGLEGSKARHVSIKEYYAGVGMALPEKTLVELPEPSMGERLKPAQYGQRVAESVLDQVGPELKAGKAKGAELELVRKQLKELKARTANTAKYAKEADARAVAAEAKAEHYRELVELFTPDEIEWARERRNAELEAERLAAEKAAAEAVLAEERQRRIDALPGLRRATVGAEHTFVNHALEAIELAGGDADKVEWNKVEGAAAREAIRENGQSPESVARAICEYSPNRASLESHAKATAWVQQKAPAWEQEYEARRGRGYDLSR